jgi:hypothetical protein
MSCPVASNSRTRSGISQRNLMGSMTTPNTKECAVVRSKLRKLQMDPTKFKELYWTMMANTGNLALHFTIKWVWTGIMGMDISYLLHVASALNPYQE